jgi:hypothetical protein
MKKKIHVNILKFESECDEHIRYLFKCLTESNDHLHNVSFDRLTKIYVNIIYRI